MDDFEYRFGAAKAHRRDEVEDDAREIYKFCFNGRESEWDRAKRKRSNNNSAEEIFTDVPATVAEDFGGMLLDTMMPENTPWVGYELSGATEENKDAGYKELQEFEQIIESEWKRSNFYDEAGASFADATIGNIAFWVDRPSLSQPVRWRSLPISSCYFRLGLNGIDDRFLQEMYYYRDLKALFPLADFPRELKQKINKSKTGQASVVWGFWQTYDDPVVPIWRQEIRVDGKPIGLDENIGPDGACPFIVGRFNPYSSSAWGRGPGRRMLPLIRVMNELTMMNLEGMDKTLNPAIVYPHDGILDLSEGIESNIGYPSMPGSGDAVREIGVPKSLDYGFFSEERAEMYLRNGFYLDVEQKGKTPPSASQYMGQRSKQVARISRPGKKTWSELGVGALKRVEWLTFNDRSQTRGTMIEDGIVVPRPISPLERAQALEEVTTADGLVGMMTERLGPQVTAALVDGPKTYSNIKDKLRDRLVQLRSQDQLMEFMRQMNEQGQPTEGA